MTQPIDASGDGAVNPTLRLLIMEELPVSAGLVEGEVRKVFPEARLLSLRAEDDLPAVLASFRPDAVLSPWPFPRCGARSLAQVLQEGAVPTPCIAVASAMDGKEAVACMEDGAWNYIVQDDLGRLAPALLGALKQRRLYEEQQRTAAAFRESEGLYRSLFENNHAVILLVEPETGAIVDANPAAAAYYGCSREELCRMGIGQINTLPIDAVREEMVRAHRLQRRHFLFKHRLADGTLRDVEVYSGPISVEGRPLLYSIVHDITERVEAENDLRRAHLCIDHAAIGIFRVDETGKILEANRQGCEDFGYTRQELLEMTVFDVDEEFTPESWLEHRRQIRAQGTGTIETHVRRKDGFLFPAEVTVNYFEHGGESFSFSFVRDITERKRSEAELRKLSQAVQQSPTAIVLTDLHGRIEYVNPSFTRITGYTFEEVREKPWCSLNGDGASPQECERRWEAIVSKGGWSGELISRRKDGAPFWDRTSLSPVRDASGAITHYLAIKEDISELKNMQAQFMQNEKLASIGLLAAGVAHEINNPIGFVKSNLFTLRKYVERLGEFLALQEERLERDDPDGPSIAQERRRLKIDRILDDLPALMEESLDGVERVRTIVQNLRSFSRVDESRYCLADVHQCLDDTLSILRNELKYTCVVVRSYSELPAIWCYPQLLNQVFMNLLVNAAQAIEGRGEIRIVTSTSGADVRIAISDTGRGIPREHFDRIFSPFFTTKAPGKGTGLGLSIAYDIVTKKHGGAMAFVSEEGKGTTFIVTLPIANPDILAQEDGGRRGIGGSQSKG